MLVIKLRYVDNKIESLPNTNTVAMMRTWNITMKVYDSPSCMDGQHPKQTSHLVIMFK